MATNVVQQLVKALSAGMPQTAWPPGSEEERAEAYAYAKTHAGKTVKWNSSWIGTIEAVVIGYYRAGTGRWLVAIDLAVTEKTLKFATYGQGFFPAHEGEAFMLASRYILAGAGVEELTLAASAPTRNDRYPHTCKWCSKPCYDGAYAFEHKATGSRVCP